MRRSYGKRSGLKNRIVLACYYSFSKENSLIKNKTCSHFPIFVNVFSIEEFGYTENSLEMVELSRPF